MRARCGHGHFDMKGYDDYLTGKLEPFKLPKERIRESISRLRFLYPQLNE